MFCLFISNRNDTDNVYFISEPIITSSVICHRKNCRASLPNHQELSNLSGTEMSLTISPSLCIIAPCLTTHWNGKRCLINVQELPSKLHVRFLSSFTPRLWFRCLIGAVFPAGSLTLLAHWTLRCGRAYFRVQYYVPENPYLWGLCKSLFGVVKN